MSNVKVILMIVSLIVYLSTTIYAVFYDTNPELVPDSELVDPVYEDGLDDEPDTIHYPEEPYYLERK